MKGHRYSIERGSDGAYYISDHHHQHIYLMFIDRVDGLHVTHRLVIAQATATADPRFAIFEREVVNFSFWVSEDIMVEAIVRDISDMLFKGDNIAAPMNIALNYGCLVGGVPLTRQRSADELH